MSHFLWKLSDLSVTPSSSYFVCILILVLITLIIVPSINFGSWWWTERPDVRQSMGSQRVGHDRATELMSLFFQISSEFPEESGNRYLSLHPWLNCFCLVISSHKSLLNRWRNLGWDVTVLPFMVTDTGGKESACDAGDLGWISGSGRSPGEGNDNPFKYSCLENSMDRGAWWATVLGVTESDTTEHIHGSNSLLLKR